MRLTEKIETLRELDSPSRAQLARINYRYYRREREIGALDGYEDETRRALESYAALSSYTYVDDDDDVQPDVDELARDVNTLDLIATRLADALRDVRRARDYAHDAWLAQRETRD